ncbi:putative tripartite motif-containing protein 16-like [Triplophysa rosa]|uniref:Tripartite motif-containing protein 16-like n=1 Tax=Triplophysa rosa TaxID=992332 RepID=A0A9W8C6W6_TRIRA|nr:putative tripartite motif-containing protein 16-like [Triplophysa rosa]
MAEASVPLSQDQFSCSICLDLLKGPVTIPCGHSYCMSCITDYWDHDDQKRVYSCPQCRQTFSPRPVLGKNTMLAEVVEKLKNTQLQTARPDHCYAGPENVECDVCTERKHKAVKSCLACLNSYCQTHFERHEELHSGKRHKVTDATGRLQQMICPQHEKLLEIYCHTDQRCICYLCMVDEHKNHKTVSAAAERTEKQVRVDRSAQAAVEDSERIFTELIRSIERSRSEVIQLIRDQEKAAVSRAEELLKQLEQEIDDLRRRDAELDQISHTDDHIHFLQVYRDLKNTTVTLDPKTANRYLRLFEGNRVITCTYTVQLYPDHPDRFDNYRQVLCRESVCGRCYWEVEWSGGVDISVSYKSISRKGYECSFGRNDQSWSFCCTDSSCSFWHNNFETKVPVVSRSSRIGVYVDHSAGTLSFYSISDTMTLIHRVHTTFTQPLYPGFRVYK